MKSIDKAILGMVSESSGCNESERIGDHRKTRPQGPSCRVDGEDNMDRRKLTEAAIHLGGALATARGQGYIEQLEKPYPSQREIGGAGNRLIRVVDRKREQ